MCDENRKASLQHAGKKRCLNPHAFKSSSAANCHAGSDQRLMNALNFKRVRRSVCMAIECQNHHFQPNLQYSPEIWLSTANSHDERLGPWQDNITLRDVPEETEE